MAEASASPDGAPRLFTPTFILICLATFAFFFAFYVLLPTIPLYAVILGSLESEIGLIVGAFSFSALILRPLAGRAIDSIGRRVVMLGGALVFFLAPLAYQWAWSTPTLLAGRLFHGMGMGLFTTAATAVVTDIAPLPRRGEAMGYFGMSANLAMAGAPAVGMAIVDRFSFPVLFAASAAVAGIAVGLSWWVEETGTRRPATASVMSLDSLFSRRALFPAGIALALMLSYGAIVTFLPIHGRDVGMANPGLFFTVYAATLLVVRAKAGGLSDRVGRWRVIVPGMALVAAAMVVLGLSSSPAAILTVGVLYGLGFGAAQPALMALTADRVEAHERGRAMATFYAALELGIGSGAFLLGLIFARAGFLAMCLVAAAMALAGAWACGIGSRRSLPLAPGVEGR